MALIVYSVFREFKEFSVVFHTLSSLNSLNSHYYDSLISHFSRYNFCRFHIFLYL